MVPGPVLSARDVPPPVSGAQGRKAAEGRADTGTARQFSLLKLKEARAEFEREFITRKLRENKGNISKTADEIGVERSNLHRKIKALGVEMED